MVQSHHPSIQLARYTKTTFCQVFRGFGITFFREVLPLLSPKEKLIPSHPQVPFSAIQLTLYEILKRTGILSSTLDPPQLFAHDAAACGVVEG